jgi:hypothetical protein
MMSEFTPQFAPIVVLLFLGAVLLVAISILVLFYGAARRSKFFAVIGAVAAFSVVAGYALLLCGVSLASSERNLPPGGRKYFCEIDCHLAYSIVSARTAAVIGAEMHQTSAHGQFVIVRLRTWFDEHSISPHRGNSPLAPDPRQVVLVDEKGSTFARSREGETALFRLGSSSTPLTEALRPGESYTTNLVFDVPKDTRSLRLWIAEDDPESRLVIGHENSFFHKKIYLDVDTAASRAVMDSK